MTRTSTTNIICLIGFSLWGFVAYSLAKEFNWKQIWKWATLLSLIALGFLLNSLLSGVIIFIAILWFFGKLSNKIDD